MFKTHKGTKFILSVLCAFAGKQFFSLRVMAENHQNLNSTELL